MFINSLSYFTEFHRRKLEKSHCQFCFLCSCWRNKISTNTDVFLWARADYLSFRPQSACGQKYMERFLKWPNTVFVRAFSDAIQRARKGCKNKRAVNRKIILFTQHQQYLRFFLYYWTQKKTVSTRLVWNVITRICALKILLVVQFSLLFILIFEVKITIARTNKLIYI